MDEERKVTMMEDETAEHFVTVIGTSMEDAWDPALSEEERKEAYADAARYAKDSWEEKTRKAVEAVLDEIYGYSATLGVSGDPMNGMEQFEYNDPELVTLKIMEIRQRYGITNEQP